jgi:hypothetical protein
MRPSQPALTSKQRLSNEKSLSAGELSAFSFESTYLCTESCVTPEVGAETDSTLLEVVSGLALQPTNEPTKNRVAKKRIGISLSIENLPLVIEFLLALLETIEGKTVFLAEFIPVNLDFR